MSEGTGGNGGDGGQGASAGGAGGTGAAGGGGSGGGVSSGDCNTDADCPGSTCVEITPGGFRVCKTSYPAAEMCLEPDFDECCSTADCAAGTCMAGPVVPYCGGPAQLEYNLCAKDLCTSDDECGGDLCAPAGTMNNKVRVCTIAICKLDTDCKAEAGGICAPVNDACCNNPMGLYCVYPSDGCRSTADCGQGEYCGVADGAARCIVGDVVCPA